MIKNVGSSRKFFQKNVQNFFKQILKEDILKEDTMLLATGFATVSQVANYCQIPMLHHKVLLLLS